MADKIEVKVIANILDIVSKFAQLRQEAAKLSYLGDLKIVPNTEIDQKSLNESLKNSVQPVTVNTKLNLKFNPIDFDLSSFKISDVVKAVNGKLSSITAALRVTININPEINIASLSATAIKAAIDAKTASVGNTTINKKATIVINPTVDTSNISASGIDGAIRKALASIDSLKTKFNTRIIVDIGVASAQNRLNVLIRQANQLIKLLQDPIIVNINSGLGQAQLAGLQAQIAALKAQLDGLRNAGVGSAGNSDGGTAGMNAGLGVAIIKAAALLYTLKQIADAAMSIVMPGFDLTKDMEINKLGIAGIIQSMTLLNGKAVSFGDAMQMSADITAKLQKDAIRTGATMEELVTVYRAILAPGIGAGMNLEQIQKITTMGANAVKAIMPGSGKTSMQLVQEVRDLVQGGITASSSTLATSLGITDADITRAKQSAGGLFQYLNDKLSGFDDVSKAFPNTLQGKMDNLKEVATLASAEITKAFGGEITDTITYLTSLFGELDTKTGTLRLNPTIISTIQEIKQTTQEWVAYWQGISLGDGVTNTLKNTWQVLKDVWSIATNTVQAFRDFGSSSGLFSGIDSALTNISGGIKSVADALAKWKVLPTIIVDVTIAFGAFKLATELGSVVNGIGIAAIAIEAAMLRIRTALAAATFSSLGASLASALNLTAIATNVTNAASVIKMAFLTISRATLAFIATPAGAALMAIAAAAGYVAKKYYEMKEAQQAAADSKKLSDDMANKLAEYRKKKGEESKNGSPNDQDNLTKKFTEESKAAIDARNKIQELSSAIAKARNDNPVKIAQNELDYANNQLSKVSKDNKEEYLNAQKRQIEAQVGVYKAMIDQQSALGQFVYASQKLIAEANAIDATGGDSSTKRYEAKKAAITEYLSEVDKIRTSQLDVANSTARMNIVMANITPPTVREGGSIWNEDEKAVVKYKVAAGYNLQQIELMNQQQDSLEKVSNANKLGERLNMLRTMLQSEQLGAEQRKQLITEERGVFASYTKSITDGMTDAMNKIQALQSKIMSTAAQASSLLKDVGGSEADFQKLANIAVSNYKGIPKPTLDDMKNYVAYQKQIAADSGGKIKMPDLVKSDDVMKATQESVANSKSAIEKLNEIKDKFEQLQSEVANYGKMAANNYFAEWGGYIDKLKNAMGGVLSMSINIDTSAIGPAFEQAKQQINDTVKGLQTNMTIDLPKPIINYNNIQQSFNFPINIQGNTLKDVDSIINNATDNVARTMHDCLQEAIVQYGL